MICPQNKYLCGDECIFKHLPCKGVCPDPEAIFCDGKCTLKKNAWDCNGTCKHVDKACNEVCPTVGNVSHIQESYFKCPKEESCFLLSEMCNYNSSLGIYEPLCNLGGGTPVW